MERAGNVLEDKMIKKKIVPKNGWQPLKKNIIDLLMQILHHKNYIYIFIVSLTIWYTNQLVYMYTLK